MIVTDVPPVSGPDGGPMNETTGAGATQIGAVMGKVLPQFKGRADGGTINAIAREELSKQG